MGGSLAWAQWSIGCESERSNKQGGSNHGRVVVACRLRRYDQISGRREEPGAQEHHAWRREQRRRGVGQRLTSRTLALKAASRSEAHFHALLMRLLPLCESCREFIQRWRGPCIETAIIEVWLVSASAPSPSLSYPVPLPTVTRSDLVHPRPLLKSPAPPPRGLPVL